jgi:hypothetical protein
MQNWIWQSGGNHWLQCSTLRYPRYSAESCDNKGLSTAEVVVKLVTMQCSYEQVSVLWNGFCNKLYTMDFQDSTVLPDSNFMKYTVTNSISVHSIQIENLINITKHGYKSKSTIFWNVIPCSMIDRYNSRRKRCFHLHGIQLIFTSLLPQRWRE